MLAEQFLANLRLCFLKKYIPHFYLKVENSYSDFEI